MIKIGSIVQSAYKSLSGKEGNIGIVLKFHDDVPTLMQVFYPKTRTSGWVVSKDMKVVA